MKKLWLGVVVLAVFPLAGCINPPPGIDLPFRVETSGTVDITEVGRELNGTAQGTFIAGSMVGSINTLGGVGGCDFPSQINGVTTLTARNGDTLELTSSGTFCRSSVNPTIVTATQTYTITGGTGRFSDATGNGTSLTEAFFPTNSAFDPGTFTGTLEGTIRFSDDDPED